MKIKKGIIFLLIFWLLPLNGLAKSPVEVFYFYDQSCYTCQTMGDAMSVIDAKYPSVNVFEIDVSKDKQSRTIFEDMMKLYNVSDRSVPTVIIGSDIFIGYSAEVISQVEQTIQICQNHDCPSPPQILRDYYSGSTGADEKSAKSSIIFWAAFIVFWPVLGGLSIYLVMRKYNKKKHRIF